MRITSWQRLLRLTGRHELLSSAAGGVSGALLGSLVSGALGAFVGALLGLGIATHLCSHASGFR